MGVRLAQSHPDACLFPGMAACKDFEDAVCKIHPAGRFVSKQFPLPWWAYVRLLLRVLNVANSLGTDLRVEDRQARFRNQAVDVAIWTDFALCYP